MATGRGAHTRMGTEERWADRNGEKQCGAVGGITSAHAGLKRGSKRRAQKETACSPDGKTECGVDPAGREVGEGAGDGRVRCHLADVAEGSVRGGADERVDDERADGARALEGLARPEEETRAERARDLSRE